MDNYDFIKQYARYLVLERKESELSKAEKTERDLIHTNLRDYVITGEDLLEGDLIGCLPDEFFKDRETEEHIGILESKLERMRKEIQGKQGQFIVKIRQILY